MQLSTLFFFLGGAVFGIFAYRFALRLIELKRSKKKDVQ